jgi:hypothetical protein
MLTDMEGVMRRVVIVVAGMTTLMLLTGCKHNEYVPVDYSAVSVPTKITYHGKTFINCRVVPDYPFDPGERELETIAGETHTYAGSQQHPMFATGVAGKILFHPKKRRPVILDCPDGTELRVTGYCRPTVISYEANGGGGKIYFPNAFFVSEIYGWVNVRCDLPADEPYADDLCGINFWLNTAEFDRLRSE